MPQMTPASSAHAASNTESQLGVTCTWKAPRIIWQASPSTTISIFVRVIWGDAPTDAHTTANLLFARNKELLDMVKKQLAREAEITYHIAKEKQMLKRKRDRRFACSAEPIPDMLTGTMTNLLTRPRIIDRLVLPGELGMKNKVVLPHLKGSKK